MNLRNVDLTIGERITRDGCFTFESYIISQGVTVIGRRLGLPAIRLMRGVYIAYPERIPTLEEFEMAGVTYDSTDKFVTYKDGKTIYDAQKFQSKELYSKNAPIPVDFDALKKQYHNVFAPEKLVKVVPAIGHENQMKYPVGGVTPQFIAMAQLVWEVKYFIPVGSFFSK